MTQGYVTLVTSFTVGSTGESMTFVGHAGLITPEIGLKYVLRERMNIGIDLVSVPIVFNPAFAQAAYRVSVYLGANF